MQTHRPWLVTCELIELGNGKYPDSLPCKSLGIEGCRGVLPGHVRAQAHAGRCQTRFGAGERPQYLLASMPCAYQDNVTNRCQGLGPRHGLMEARHRLYKGVEASKGPGSKVQV